jgi:hypothetical protein
MAEVLELACPHCGKDVPRKTPGQRGAQRTWCSAKCRRAACAERKKRPCSRCGGETSANSAWINPTNALCASCHHAATSAANRERMDDIAQLWNEGATLEEIKAYMGYGPKSNPPLLTRMMRLGVIEARREGYRRKHAEIGA